MFKIVDNIEEVLNEESAVLYFTATWCQPCKQLKPIYAKAAVKDNNNNYYVVDVDSIDSEYLTEYNIKSVPTILKLNNGVIKKTITSRTEEEIIKQVNGE
jgi:thioredoxin 1